MRWLRPLDILWFIAGLLLLISFLISFFANPQSQLFRNIGEITSLTALILGLLNYLIWRWEKAYLLVSRWISWIKNTTLQMSWACTFTGSIPLEDLPQLLAVLENKFGGRVLTREQDKFVVSFPQWALRILVSWHSRDGWDLVDYTTTDTDHSITSNSSVIRIDGETRISFRDAQKMLENTIIPLLEATQNNLDAAWSKGELSIQLPSENPYWGVMIRRLPKEEVSSFGLDIINTKFGGRDTVHIGKQSIDVIAETLSGFQALSKRYLSLGQVES